MLLVFPLSKLFQYLHVLALWTHTHHTCMLHKRLQHLEYKATVMGPITERDWTTTHSVWLYILLPFRSSCVIITRDTSATFLSRFLCVQPSQYWVSPDSAAFLFVTKNEWKLPCSGYSSTRAWGTPEDVVKDVVAFYVCTINMILTSICEHSKEIEEEGVGRNMGEIG